VSRFAFIAAVIAAAPAHAETHYFGAMPDLPLPAGFAELHTATGFDGATGRLVMADATGVATPAQVRSFYNDSLPALGWSLSPTGDDELVFLRGRERLAFTVSGEPAHLRLHVQLTVRPASMNAD